MLYLASERECSTNSWDETNPRFFVAKENTYSIEPVKRQFSKPNVYYVGSHEGCGCGFRQTCYEMVDDQEEINQAARNQKHLFEFVSARLEDENFIELYACWAGSESEPFQSKREIIADELLKDDFYFKEDELIIVRK